MCRQLWVVLACLVVLGGVHLAEAQEDIPSIVVYMVQEPAENHDRYNYDLYVVNTETGETVFESRTADHECAKGLSSNHQWLLYNIISPDGANAPMTYAVDLQTGESIALGNAQSARWSADNQRLIYSEFYDSGQNVYIFDIQSREIHLADFIMTFSPLAIEWIGEDWVYAQIVENRVMMDGARQVSQSFDGDILYFAFSPDAQWIAVVAGEGGDRYLFVIDTNSGETQQIDDTAIGGADPVWSSDGYGLSYTIGTGIVLWDAEQRASRELTNITERFANRFTWSSDNHYLAYLEYVPGGTENSQFVIQILDIETDEVQFVTRHTDTFAGELAWVTDTQLAYTYADSEAPFDERIRDVYLYDITTGKSVNLTNSAETEWFKCALG